MVATIMNLTQKSRNSFYKFPPGAFEVWHRLCTWACDAVGKEHVCLYFHCEWVIFWHINCDRPVCLIWIISIRLNILLDLYLLNYFEILNMSGCIRFWKLNHKKRKTKRRINSKLVTIGALAFYLHFLVSFAFF